MTDSVRLLSLAVAALVVCDRGPEPAPTRPGATTSNALPWWLPTRGEEVHGRIEVEVVGGLKDRAKARKYLVFVLSAPCDLRTLDQVKPMGGIDSVEGGSKEKVFGF